MTKDKIKKLLTVKKNDSFYQHVKSWYEKNKSSNYEHWKKQLDETILELDNDSLMLIPVQEQRLEDKVLIGFDIRWPTEVLKLIRDIKNDPQHPAHWWRDEWLDITLNSFQTWIQLESNCWWWFEKITWPNINHQNRLNQIVLEKLLSLYNLIVLDQEVAVNIDLMPFLYWWRIGPYTIISNRQPNLGEINNWWSLLNIIPPTYYFRQLSASLEGWKCLEQWQHKLLTNSAIKNRVVYGIDNYYPQTTERQQPLCGDIVLYNDQEYLVYQIDNNDDTPLYELKSNQDHVTVELAKINLLVTWNKVTVDRLKTNSYPEICGCYIIQEPIKDVVWILKAGGMILEQQLKSLPHSKN